MGRTWLLVAFGLALVLAACSKSRSPSVGGETNWLRLCGEEQPCAAGSCLCGVCTRACEDSAQCAGDFDGICTDSSGTVGELLCAGDPERPSAALCLPQCASDRGCGSGFSCRDGACVPAQAAAAMDGGGSTPVSAGDAATASDAATPSDAAADDAGALGGASFVATPWAPQLCGNVSCGFACCDNQCVNFENDHRNCGACGRRCEGDYPFCFLGQCTTPECGPAVEAGCERCCGDSCCGADERCCASFNGVGGIGWQRFCVPNDDQPCNVGCYTCMCAAPDTPVDTPDGERPIGELAAGDLVFSVENGQRVVVPIALATRTAVPPAHVLVHVSLSNGSTIAMSPGHPTAGGGTFGDLALGDRLGNLAIVGLQLVPSEHDFTVDILPASSTGAYFARGALVGSTLQPSARR